MHNHAKGFTLIELLVVIAIIGILSSVVIASLSSARLRANDTAAYASANEILKMIAACAIDGGKITVPDSTTAPTNSLCTLGASYGTWPKPMSGWALNQGITTTGESNLLGINRVSGNFTHTTMYCGYHNSWAGYCGTVHVGMCRVATDFSCARYNSSTAVWE